MTKGLKPRAGSRPADDPSPSWGSVSENTTPMLSATASNNHSLFSFGRNNGSDNVAAASGNPSTNSSAHHGDDSADRSTFDFLPSVSFDDLQSSLESASHEFKLAQFPLPSGQGAILDPKADRPVKPVVFTAGGPVPSAGPGSSRIAGPSSTPISAVNVLPAARNVRAGILRRPSLTNRQSSIPASSSVSDTTSAAVATRQRRPSHYPPVSNSNLSKAPRKSVNSGIFDPEQGSGLARSSSRRRPSVTSISDGPASGSTRSSLDSSNRLSGSLTGSRTTTVKPFQFSGGAPKASAASGSSQNQSQNQSHPARAMGPTSRAPRSSNGLSNNSTPIHNSTISVGFGSASKGSASQPSSAKRASVAPSALHATGLGARTISPTDTRRLKRMSTMPPSNSSSLTASGSTGASASASVSVSASTTTSTLNIASTASRDTAQLAAVSLPPSGEVRASSRSPSVLPPKTSTPSSQRTTPDPNRKTYTAGLSAGSSANYNAARNSVGSVQPRLPQASMPIPINSSRLPGPKTLAPRTSMSNLDDGEDVPPVPAIPKAYESPKGSPAELSFLEKRKSGLAFDSSSTRSTSTASLSGSHPQSLEPPAKIQRQASTRAFRSGDKTSQLSQMSQLNQASQTSQASQASQASQPANGVATSNGNNKKNLQPLRLPPINLQPLSTPTTAKIAALQQKNTTNRNLSPPPSRIIAKTPTTPMTAKGSFFSRHRHDDDLADFPAAIRSSSSVHHHTRRDSPSGEDTASSSDSIAPVPTKSPFHKPSMSPFSSSSVPKGGSPMSTNMFKRRTIDGNDGDFAGVFTTPALPPIPVTTPHRPSGPRAPAPTPSRAFAAMEAASAIIASAAAAMAENPMPPLKTAMLPPAKSPPPLSSPEEPPTPSSIGSSLRRKLSLSWKRNNKAVGGAQPEVAVPSTSGDPSKQPQPPQQHHLPFHHKRQSSANVKHDGMPPPRIPISATLNSLKASPTSDLPRDPTRRKTSASSMNAIVAHDRTDKKRMADSQHKKEMTINTLMAAAEANASTSTVSSTRTYATQNSSAVQKIVKGKASSSSLRQQKQSSQQSAPQQHLTHRHRHHEKTEAVSTSALDKDDLVAEEEMRKLGSRRKETELAARTLDALRKRATPKERVSPQEAIRIAMLNIYERGEIIDYNDVYFCGTQNAAKVVGDLHADLPNFGYDDERGDYSIVPGDHLAYRYEIIDLLGKGSFGQVVRCIDHKTGVLVAVKIIRNKKRFHQQALVEVNILQKLREWDPQNKHSMVNFTHSFYFRGHLCISTELLDMNLYEFIKANGFRGFSIKMIRRFTKQLLGSLMLLKQHRVIHCDLKPENILLRHPLHTEIKTIDFGSSCFENEKVYTYIQSRFYRSPEVILGMTYGMPIDMWSLGCILAELYTGVPIFPGENEQEQLACIMEVFGPPEKHLIEKSTRKKLFFDSMGKPRLTVSSKGRRRRPSSKTLQQAIKCDDEPFLDFLGRCLRWDPDRRLKPEEALRHEFITHQKTVPMLMGRASNGSVFALSSGGGSGSSNSRDGGSPIRRHNTIVGTGPRPLPEPPAGSGLTTKLSAPPTMRAVGGVAGSSIGSSPHKSNSMGPTMSSSRRASAVTGSTVSVAKRTSGGVMNSMSNMSSSNLPRAAGRVVSGTTANRADLAAAGATAAMTRRA
ncbi:dual specificity protein kinase pom1 [Grosmannia clavigera kw1407]|uniref:dual-specificity kinase n=1 Tax=Grosmannia clavigera (strain kw1407 / UAMH 11150) TaxID=655863 RepID=F0XSR5_GROCL|nr:dual specificity protein kinase pom1 [Grosmannia clavigera kw1407]EFW99251.1 dual specificity protein kinase pom1 [Grosmannia clavigera kw1407]